MQAAARSPLELVARANSGDLHLQLRLARFAALAEFPTLTRASEALGVEQSTLSVAVKTLEQQLGVGLLDRAQRGMPGTLTAAGRELHAYIIESGITLPGARQDINEIQRGGQPQ